MQNDQSIIDAWSGVAPFWEKHRQSITEMFAPVSQALIEEAQLGPSQTVLDIATGPGEPALTIAALLGPEGKVVGVDPILEMVAAARRAADDRGLRNAQFEVAFAGNLPFPANTFDAVISRFGAMFFPVPVEGVREMLRVLRPNGKLALAVWNSAETNPFFHVLSGVVDRYVEPLPPVPDAPNAFRFAEPGKLRDILIEAGAAAPSERVLKFAINSSVSAEDFWAIRSETSDSLRGKLATLSPAQLAELTREVFEASRPYSSAQGISFPAEVRIVSAVKP